MKKSIVIIAMVAALSGCSTVEKRYQFKSDTSAAHSDWVKCKRTMYGNDVVKVGDKVFYFVNSYRNPAWVGPLLVPLVPNSPGKTMSELQLIVSEPAGSDMTEWSIEFLSDHVKVHPEKQSGTSQYWKFKFPRRPISDSFDLVIPQGPKTVRVHYPTRDVEFKYAPLSMIPVMILMADSFPGIFDCDQ